MSVAVNYVIYIYMFQKTPTLVNLLNYDYKSDICFQQPFNVKYPIYVISMFSERYISVFIPYFEYHDKLCERMHSEYWWFIKIA